MTALEARRLDQPSRSRMNSLPEGCLDKKTLDALSRKYPASFCTVVALDCTALTPDPGGNDDDEKSH